MKVLYQLFMLAMVAAISIQSGAEASTTPKKLTFSEALPKFNLFMSTVSDDFQAKHGLAQMPHLEGESQHTYQRIQEKGLSFNDGMSNAQLYWIVFGFTILTVCVLCISFACITICCLSGRKK